jgi:hypothetical protein
LFTSPPLEKGGRGDLKLGKIPLNPPLPKGDSQNNGKTDVEKKPSRKANDTMLRVISPSDVNFM